MSEPAITFVIYSEDGAQASLATVEQVLLGMLRQVCPAVKTNHIRREPALPAEERISGNLWKTGGKTFRDNQRLRRLLIGHVATALARGKVVFFHIDADAVWAERQACKSSSEHWRRFCKDVSTALASLGKGAGPRDQTELDQVLILAMPFYELESWAFANTARLREILTSAKDLAALVRWESDLAALDEIANIKDVLSIGHAHNLELVQGKRFPAAALEELGKSYAATVARLRGSEVVRRGLAEAAARAF